MLCFSQQYDKDILIFQCESLGVKTEKSEIKSFGGRALGSLNILFLQKTLAAAVITVSFANEKLGQRGRVGVGCLFTVEG